MRRAPFTDVDTLLAWLGQLPAHERVRTARLLTDTHTAGPVKALADSTVYDLTRDAPAADVAEQLGLSLKQVRRAVEDHRTRERASSAPAAR